MAANFCDGIRVVVVYYAGLCPLCVRVCWGRFGNGTQRQFVELDERQDGNAIRYELSQLTGRTSVPQIWIGGKFAGGCNDGAFSCPFFLFLVIAGGYESLVVHIKSGIRRCLPGYGGSVPVSLENHCLHPSVQPSATRRDPCQLSRGVRVCGNTQRGAWVITIPPSPCPLWYGASRGRNCVFRKGYMHDPRHIGRTVTLSHSVARAYSSCYLTHPTLPHIPPSLPLIAHVEPHYTATPHVSGPGVFTLMEKGELVPMLEAAGCSVRQD